MPQRRGFRWDGANNELEVHVNGTEVGKFTSEGFGLVGRGTVTQITSRSTGVTVNALGGTITTATTSLAAEASAEFTVTNSFVDITDVVVCAIQSGTVALNTQVEVTDVANGTFNITVINNNVAAGTPETGAILINFAIIKLT